MMKISDITRNERVIKVRLEESELADLAIKAVLKEAEIYWEAGLKCRAWHSARDTSTGIQHDMEVEIIADLSVLPRAME
jgi:hypothetical protein